MAAPAVARYQVISFRDAKGQTARIRVLIGGATDAAVAVNRGTMETYLTAFSNAHVTDPYVAVVDRAYGTNNVYKDIEDHALLTFSDAVGHLHRFRIPAPIAAVFLADGETVDNAPATVTNLTNLAFGTFAYGSPLDTSPLVYIGGTRGRGPTRRRFNIFTKDPSLTEPGL